MNQRNGVTAIESPPAAVMEGPSVGSALEHVVDAGQRMIADRIDLVRLELTALAVRSLRGVVLMSAGAALGGVAWLGLMTVAVLLLERVWPLTASLAAVVVFNLALGGILVAVGVHATRVHPGERRHAHLPSPSDMAREGMPS